MTGSTRSACVSCSALLRQPSEHTLEALSALGRCALCGASCAIALSTGSPVAWLWAGPYVWHLFAFLRETHRALVAS